MPLFRRKPDKPSEVQQTESMSSQPAFGEMGVQNGFMQQGASLVVGAPLPPPPPKLLIAEAEYDARACLRTKSRLSQTLEEVLSDNGALAYLIQFAEERGSKPLVKFWMEAQSFRASCLLRRPTASVSPLPSPTHRRASAKAPCKADLAEKSSGDCCPRVESLSTPRVPAIGTGRFPADEEVPTGPEERAASSLTRTQASSRTLFTCNVSTDDVTDSSAPVGEGGGGQALQNGTKQHRIPSPTLRRDSLSQDAVHIFNKYIAQNAPLPIGIPEDLRGHIAESISRDCIESDCFLPAQQFVVSQMEKELFPSFLRSPYNCKHQVDVLTSGEVSLADILYNDAALFYFMEYMEQEQCRHLVDFLLMADNFRNHLLTQGNYDGLQAQEDAMVIYDKYFSLQATTSLGFSDTVRLEVEQNICREDGPLPSCFEKPVMILMQHLDKNHLKHFLSSQLYVKYITECIVTIQTANQNVADSPRRNKRSGSDSSSSEASMASQMANTLLAMDGKQPGTPGGSSTRRILRNVEGSDMKIDTGQFNPDALWKRNLAGKLQMAHVDHLGKVTTEFEPEPDKRTGSNLTKAFRKLVNWDVDKTEEDLAWQVAEMIVKDICTVTLCPGPASQDNG